MTEKLNNWLENLPPTLEARLHDAVGHEEFAELNAIPMEYALEEAYVIITDYAEADNELCIDLSGENGEEAEAFAKADLKLTAKYADKWQKEVDKKKNGGDGIETQDSGNTSSNLEEGADESVKNENITEQEEQKEPEQKGEAEQKEAKPKESKGKFKWLNRPKATMTAVELKNEENISATEACERVMKEYEGVYFENPSLISSKRWENFIERVEAGKTYKKSKTEVPDYNIVHNAISELKEKGELTDLQAIALDGLFVLLTPYEVGYSNAQVEDIAGVTGLKPEQVKGTLTHLIKKGLVYTNETKVEEEMKNLIYIDKDSYKLYNPDVLATKDIEFDEDENDADIEEPEVEEKPLVEDDEELNAELKELLDK